MDIIQNTLNERGSRYGTLKGNGTISQRFKKIARGSVRWDELSEDKQEAIDNIVQKMARILSGDPEYIDNWLDIEGYARLVREELERVQKEKENVSENSPMAIVSEPKPTNGISFWKAFCPSCNRVYCKSSEPNPDTYCECGRTFPLQFSPWQTQ